MCVNSNRYTNCFKKQVQLIYYVKVVFPRIVGVLIYCMKASSFPV
uniref:Uncharacterized protein n=1 Tax=Anguilla anguilla TaxID=7936 RepID=A0A0E9VL46_ANGAN